MNRACTRIDLELPSVSGGAEFLQALGDWIGAEPSDSGAGIRLPARRPEACAPDVEIRLADCPGPQLRGHGPDPFCVSFEASFGEGGRPPSFHRGAVARGVEARPLELAEVRRRLEGQIRGVDHLALNLPAKTHDRRTWLSKLGLLARHCLLLPYDAEGDITFMVPATDRERETELVAADQPRKPKIELVRDAFLEVPMIGLSLDTDHSIEALSALFPTPEGVGRPGDETYFRTIALAQPWSNLIFSLDLNSLSTSHLEIAQLLVDGGYRLPRSASAQRAR